ncbi:DUF2306 domain-containing protein [uncultured Polaribacter sp.]|uniref:DUF2306 domain-containing protein n=1 Tax=uncultured Polaribacter sp. TaxID=174711 RepID=UPI00259B47A6|nr:DUF2306 domain-containing protein [uncultured Polaribacter sp.]
MFSTIGYIHLLFAIVSMVTGLVVVFNTKGTRFHKRIGYVYVINMLLLNISSFFISNFNGFSIFHFFAIVSLVTILAGMYPVLKKTKNWLQKHYYFMAWSVVGLYCAFWSEVGTRFVGNMKQFWWAVAIATFLTAFIGAKIINKNAKRLTRK